MQLETSLGNINLEIHCDFSPRTSWNFLTLCERGYYDDTIFHRLVPGFMYGRTKLKFIPLCYYCHSTATLLQLILLLLPPLLLCLLLALSLIYCIHIFVVSRLIYQLFNILCHALTHSHTRNFSQAAGRWPHRHGKWWRLRVGHALSRRVRLPSGPRQERGG